MNKIALADSGRQTTALGFGGSSLMGALNRRQSLAMLEAAFDAGIRHFDVAPMYGYGEAESCLGDFLARHRADVTITTKYGIPPAKNASMIRFARQVVGPVIKMLPAVKKRLASVANVATRNEERASFTADQAKASLERSLTELRTDRIDVWLLHEVEASDLEDDELLRFLEDQVSSGTVGAFGVGSEAAKVPALQASRPAYCRVLQYEWSVLDPAIASNGAFRIHHRALTNNFRSLHEALAGQPSICRQWSDEVGTDLAEKDNLARLMLKASLVANPASIILFSSKSTHHIQENVRTASDDSLTHAALRLHGLVLARHDQILTAMNK